MNRKANKFSMQFVLQSLLMMGLLSSLVTTGQQVIDLPADTASNEIETIAISEISIKSGEAGILINSLYESLIADEDIEKMGVESDSLIVLLDSLLAIDRTIDLKTKNIRFLNNRLVYWQNVYGVLDEEKSFFADVIQNLEEHKYDLHHEILLWRNTKTVLEKEEPEALIINRVDELMFQMDTVNDLVQKKSNKLLIMLDRITEKGVVLDTYINDVDQTAQNKKSEIFVPNQTSLFSTKLNDKSIRNFKEPLMLFYRMEVKELVTYLEHKILNVIFQLILIVVLIIAFRLIKKWILKAEINKSSFYQNMLVRVLSRSISAALILGLFASVLIFPNRPELFKDIIKLLVTIPLIIIVITFLDRKFFKYVYLFGSVIFLQMAYFMFPPGHLFYSFLIILVALIEMIVLGNLVIYFYRNSLSRKFLNKLIILMLIIHFGFAFTGLIGVLFGATILAEVSLNIPIANIFSGILVITTVIIINGLIEVGIGSPYFQKMNIFRLHGSYLKKKAIDIINFGAMILWFFAMLKVVNLYRLIVDLVISIFSDEIKIGTISFALGGIVLFFFVIWLSIVISKMVRIILEEDILKRLNLAKGVPHTIAMMVRYTLIIAGFFIAVSAVGMPLDSLTVLFGAFGVGIGFGLQNIFNNLVSGLILLFERPIQIGDTIEVGQLLGNVKSIGIRSSNVRTFDGAEVIVPNGQLISNEVVNWTLSDQRRRIEVVAGVAYGSDPHKVKELFLKVLADHPDIIDDPAPSVLFKDLGSSSLDFRLLFWTSNYDEWIRIRSDIFFGVHDILKKEGIEIPFPQQDLHLRSVDPGIEIIHKGK